MSSSFVTIGAVSGMRMVNRQSWDRSRRLFWEGRPV